MFAQVVAFCVLAIATSQAFPGRVVGGHEAPLVGFEHQLSLQYGYEFYRGHVCGASILNSRWILTAGHCITEVPQIPGADYYAVAGIHNLQEFGQPIKVKTIIVHPEYQGGVNPNDIALLELDNDIVFNDKVKAVKLPAKGSIASGKATLSGWGSTSTTLEPNMPVDLQTIDLPILTYQECANAWIALSGTSEPLARTNLCTGPINVGGEGACSGDSGGPLVLRQGNDVVQVGVVSWGLSPCGTRGAPSVFTQVSSFIDFINEYVQ